MANLKEQIANLRQLQEIDREIYALKSEKEAGPEKIKRLDEAFQEKKKNLATLEKNSLDTQMQKKERELELASKEDGIKKLQGQLYKLKTNKEYQTMLQQISGAKADMSVIEDKILESLELMDKVKSDTEKEKQKIGEEEKMVNAQKKNIQDKIKEIDEKLAQLEIQRKQIIPSIETKIMSQYEKILFNRNGMALANVKNYSCGGCNISVTPQKINLIKMYENLVACEVCNRILYTDE